MAVKRTWLCLNARCNHQFDAWEANPECPTCKCVRVQWVPGGGHMIGTAKHGDAEFRALADCFNMPDLHSAARGEAAKKPHIPAPPGRDAPVMTFAPGFSAAVNPSIAQCVPTSNKVNFKTSVGMGQRLAPSKNFPGIQTGTAIEGTHRPRQ